jgi:hypothetical protein
MTPSDVAGFARRMLDSASNLLQGEPARVIGYGAAAVVYFVARVSGAIDDIPFEDALSLTVGYVAVVAGVIESIRRIVYSPNTVAAIIEELDGPN